MNMVDQVLDLPTVVENQVKIIMTINTRLVVQVPQELGLQLLHLKQQLLKFM